MVVGENNNTALYINKHYYIYCIITVCLPDPLDWKINCFIWQTLLYQNINEPFIL